MKVAILGLGLMGTGMARRMLGAGIPLTVYNRSADKARALAADGARAADTPRAAVEGAGLVISMLADDHAGRNVWLGENGALAGVARGTILVESSTVTVGWIRELAREAERAGCELLDAPVTGSKNQAAAGELVFLVGGPEATLDKARPVLKTMSREIVHLGPTGSGAILKLINNFACGVQLASLAEAMAMVERSGLNRERAVAVLANGSPGSPMIKALSGRMTARDYQPNFMLKLMAKDLRYAEAEGEKLNLRLTTAATALDLLQKGIDAGYGEKDIASVAELFRTT